MHIFVVVFEHLVELQEELDLLLDGRHPSEVKLEQKKECQDALASDHDVLVIEQLLQGLEEGGLPQEDRADLRVVDVVQCQVEHGDEGLLHPVLAVAVQEGLAEASGRDGLEDHWEELRVELADVAQRDGRGDLDAFVPLEV